MSKHPHHDMIVEWIKDTARAVQVNDPRFADTCWIDVSEPTWQVDLEYRFKPEPKQDTVALAHIKKGASQLGGWDYRNNQTPNVRFTFDGETGQLKSAEVLK